MTKRKPVTPTRSGNLRSEAFRICLWAAAALALAVIVVGFSMLHQRIVPDTKLFFLFGAVITEVILLLIAQVLGSRVQVKK